MKVFFCILVLLFITSCASNTNEREVYWQQLLDKNIPIGSTDNDIKMWVNSAKVPLAYSATENAYLGIVEEISLYSIVCNHWFILAEIQLSSEHKSIGNHVSGAGNCL
jgi:hypothetical protein